MKIKLRALLMLLLVTTILLSSLQTEVYGINTIELEGKMVNGRFLVPMRKNTRGRFDCPSNTNMLF